MSPAKPKQDRGLWRISVSTSLEAAEAVGDCLETQFGQSVSAYTQAGSEKTLLTVYLPKRPSVWTRERVALRASLQYLERCGLPVGPGRITLRPVPAEDWSESWKRHFRPLEIGVALLIKPSWSARRPRAGQALVVLDPGLSFGTGQHPTTAFCLKQLVAQRREGEKQSFLDLGTGSGILAIAAAKLGYGPVEALDFDAEAIRTARQNACKNHVLPSVRFRQSDIARLPYEPAPRCSLIAANLVSSLLLSAQGRILSRLKPGGVVILAGILKSEFASIREAYEADGLKLISSQIEKEWRSAAFKS